MHTFIVTGDREGGKTRFLEQLTALLKEKGYACGGFLSKGFFTTDGCKDFILIPVDTQNSYHLASRKKKEKYIQSGYFYFNPQTIQTGILLINKALASNNDVIVLDEIGPSELNGQIWSTIFKLMIVQNKKINLISVRKRLVPEVLMKFSLINTTISDIENTTPEKTAEAIISMFR